ncbi:MAG: hypothetical protein AAFN17_14965, partial [Pseudomonadota bacterium]
MDRGSTKPPAQEAAPPAAEGAASAPDDDPSSSQPAPEHAAHQAGDGTGRRGWSLGRLVRRATGAF